MPTFIDESGDVGWKLESGSENFFRLGAVHLPNQENVEACRTTIQRLRASLGLSSEYEFKFSKTGTHPERRTAFFKAVHECNFSFVVCSFDKTRLSPDSYTKSGFHWASSVVLATYLRDSYELAEEMMNQKLKKPVLLKELVIVDDNQDRNFLNLVKKSFRAMKSRIRPSAPLVGKVKFRDSKPDEMLQLADMVIGAVGAHLTGEDQWYNIISTHNKGIICLP